ncbi:MAG: hypothetical protein ACTSU3_01590, partial [Candidatus Thorarchaeota archaeon]
RIGDIAVSPGNPEADETVTISATITDTNDVDEVTLYYDSTSGLVEVTMTAVGDVYSADIPGLLDGSTFFRISATDTDGNEAVRGDYTVAWGVEPTGTDTTTDTTTPPDTPVDMTILLLVGGIAALAVVFILVFVVKRR